MRSEGMSCHITSFEGFRLKSMWVQEVTMKIRRREGLKITFFFKVTGFGM